MRALIAFDKFKDALSARDACAVVRETLASVRPEIETEVCPLTDGGEGFVEVLTSALGGEERRAVVTGPRGAPVEAKIGLVPLAHLPPAARHLLALPTSLDASAPVALVEMAAASGLALLRPEQRDPWQTTSAGTGELLLVARDAGAAAIVLGVGGSATNDAGAGALAALGARFLDANGQVVVSPVPAAWPRVSEIKGQLAALPPVRIACDVSNPLLGPRGATLVYGPQKGLRPDDAERLEAEMRRMAGRLRAFARGADASATPGGGAAGGIAFGLVTALGARLVSGFELLSAWCELEARLAAADVLLTGEGRFDTTSLEGKGPGSLVLRAAALGKRVEVFAGQFGPGLPDSLRPHAITPADLPLREALPATRRLLSACVAKTFAARDTA